MLVRLSDFQRLALSKYWSHLISGYYLMAGAKTAFTDCRTNAFEFSALWLAVILSAFFLTGCTATYPVNPPLSQAMPADGYDFDNVAKRSAGTGEVLLIIAFSGGVRARRLFHMAC
jgi:hypothetical protein